MILLLLMTSCGASLTEEITINKDGSGEYKLYSDLVPMMTSMSFRMTKALVTMDSYGQDSG